MTKERISPLSVYALETYEESKRREFAVSVRRWLSEHGGSYAELARIAGVHWESVSLAASGGVISMQSYRRIELVITTVK